MLIMIIWSDHINDDNDGYDGYIIIMVYNNDDGYNML